jgi:steroid 5-alpha reductase family enzyme
MVQILITNATLLLGSTLVLWAISVRIRDVSFIDSFWAFGMVMLSTSTVLQAAGAPQRMLLIFALTSLWGLRLSIHLFTRWRAEGEDPRYRRILASAMDKKGWGWPKASLFMVFLMQAPLLFIVCLPAQLGPLASEPAELGPLAWIGTVVALTGIAFESVGDWQLRQFRADPSSKGKVLDTGLWRYTRHPNYFGDACAWWGIWLIAAETAPGRWAVIGPVLVTWLLTRLSGVPMLEYSLKKTRPGYEEYVHRTSGFFPWPPKRAG